MKLEQLIIAQKIREELEECQESIQHIDEYPKIHRSQSDIYIETGDGWGRQHIYIPKDIALEVLGLIKTSLEKKVKELKQQFEEL